MESFNKELDLFRLKARLAEALRQAFEQFKHHSTLTARVKSAIEAEVWKVLPGATVFCDFSRHAPFTGSSELAIWSGNALPYDSRFFMCWHKDGDDWRKPFLAELDRCDSADYVERMEQEKALHPRLAKMQEEIEAIREKADKLCADLGIPKAAKLRASEVHWNHATYATQYEFPALFGQENRR